MFHCLDHVPRPYSCVCAQSCPTLCDPINCSPQGSYVHGISQARILEWVAISSSKGSSWSRDQTPSFQADSLPLSHQRGPNPSILALNIWLAKKCIQVFHMYGKTKMNFLANPIHRYLTQLGPLKLCVLILLICVLSVIFEYRLLWKSDVISELSA